MRSACLEKKYIHIFSSKDDTIADENRKYDIDLDEEPDRGYKSQFKWVNVHRNIVGDDIKDEEKYMALNLYTVLNRLDAVIVENRKSKK